MSGSDLKNQIEHDSSADNSKEDTDHDIQQLVAQEDKETKQYQKKSEDESAHAHMPDTPDKGAASEEDAEKTQKPKVEYKVRSEGVKIGQSSDFWNNYELDIELARDLGEHSTITSPCNCLCMFPQVSQMIFCRTKSRMLRTLFKTGYCASGTVLQHACAHADVD